MAIQTNDNKAPARLQVGTVTVSGTHAGADTLFVAVDGQKVEVVINSTTNATIAEIMAAAVNATDRTTGLIGTEVRSIGGQEIPQMAELDAVYVAAATTFQLVTKQTHAGKPVTITVGTSGAGTFSYAEDQAATGPAHWDNDDNWDDGAGGGAEPVAGDSVVLRETSGSFKYGFPTSAFSLVNLDIHQDWTGQIGLKATNTDGPDAYQEYRTRGLKFFSPGSLIADIGEGVGAGTSRVRLIFQSGADYDMRVHNTGLPATAAEKAVQLISEGTDSNSLTVYKGSVYVQDAFFSTLNVGSVGAPPTDVDLQLRNCTIANTGTVIISGGTVDFDCDFDTAATVYIRGGKVAIRDVVSTLEMTGGYARVQRYETDSFVITQLNGYGGTLDLSGETTTVTITNATIRPGFTLRDPNDRVVFTNAPVFEAAGFTAH